jgi:phage terminase large subunit-like protein
MQNLSREEKIQLLEMQRELERRKKANPLSFSERHFKQSAFYKAQQPIRALFWGNRVGKTEIGAMEVARYLLGEHEYRDIVPPVEAWSICPSFDSQAETTQPKLLKYIPEDQIADTSTIRKGIYSMIKLKNGSMVNFKSYEQGREKFQGAGKRLIWFDEEPPHDIYEECIVRQEAGEPLDIILTMTPIKGMTWVYDELYLSTDTGLYYVSTAGWDDNPFLTEEQKDIMSRGLTREALQVRREGKFTKRVGLVCNWWDRMIHLRDYKELNPQWTYYEMLDGGYSDPAAWLLIGVDHDDSVHVVDGFREPYLKTEDIKRIRDTKIAGVQIRGGWSDDDNPRMNYELGVRGMRLTPVKKKTGTQESWDEALAGKLAEYGMVQKGTGEPRLFISNSLMRFDDKSGRESNWMMQEIENLLWTEKITDGVSEQKPRWDDHRRFGHHFDGIRALAYFLWTYKRGHPEQHKAVVTKVSDDPYQKSAQTSHISPIEEGGIL